MEITVSQGAQQWFESEFSPALGDAIRVFVKHGGHSSIHPGFSIGLSQEPPFGNAATVNAGPFRLFVRDSDLWFFDGHNLHIDYDNHQDEIVYHFVSANGSESISEAVWGALAATAASLRATADCFGENKSDNVPHSLRRPHDEGHNVPRSPRRPTMRNKSSLKNRLC